MGKLNSRFALALSLFAATALGPIHAARAADKALVFLGDSLSAGYGIRSTQAFPAVIAEKIRAAQLPYQVENAGLSGDTAAGGLRRLDWILQRPVDVLVIELGANDGLHGVAVPAIKANLQAIIDKAKAKNPTMKIILAGMQIPPNFGPDYTGKFQRIYGELAQDNKAALIPFLLEGVGGARALNQADLIHPTAAGHRIIADVIWKTLEPILRQP